MRNSMAIRRCLVLGLATLVACSDDGTGPEAARRDYSIAVHEGDGQLGGVADTLADDLQVVVRNTRTDEPVSGVAVRWTVVSGSGAALSPAESPTDDTGIARARLTLGPDTGTYRVQAAFEGLAASPAVFTVRAILPPRIHSVSPGQAGVGDTVTVLGENFSLVAGESAVLFGGFRGRVVGGTATELRAVVPACVPSRVVDVAVLVGPVASESRSLEVTGDGAAAIDLGAGEVAAFSAPAEMACVRIPGGQFGARYLVVPQNATDADGRGLGFRLLGLTGSAPILTSLGDAGPAAGEAELDRAGFGERAVAWEGGLRAHERTFSPEDALQPEPGIRIQATPGVGDRRQFNVINKQKEFTRVTAEVKYVSQHAVIYQDVNAPANGFTAADFMEFGTAFDDPIHGTVTAAFGEPSDVDGNGRVAVLFTPEVNRLTERGATGFVAGFFYGLDLLDQTGSNRAEVFYSLVPDPQGKFGDARRTEDVLSVVPPVLAHEFQHMIHFNQRVLVRRASQETIWLSEALAHMAEDLVGEVFRRGGDNVAAQQYRVSNFVRANRYLEMPSTVSLISTTPPGTLEERGAQWLFLRYLAEHYGGDALLARLTQTAAPGVSNVEAATGRSWGELVNAWSVALWADDAADLQGVEVDPIYTFPDINLRQTVGAVRGNGYPLRPAERGFSDFALQGTLPASSPAYVLLLATEPVPRPVHLSLTDRYGADFASEARPGVAILRIK